MYFCHLVRDGVQACVISATKIFNLAAIACQVIECMAGFRAKFDQVSVVYKINYRAKVGESIRSSRVIKL